MDQGPEPTEATETADTGQDRRRWVIAGAAGVGAVLLIAILIAVCGDEAEADEPAFSWIQFVPATTTTTGATTSTTSTTAEPTTTSTSTTTTVAPTT